jgi:predicted nuclease of predicted toxin-antitoxin system
MRGSSKLVRFYQDTHIAKAVALQLRDRGIDIVRCEEVGMAMASDEQHLEYAMREGRVVITNDDDFLALDKAWRLQNKRHSGIMYCLPHVQGQRAIGIIVRKCLELDAAVGNNPDIVEANIRNRIIFVS